MKHLKVFKDLDSATGRYHTPLVCILKNVSGKILYVNRISGTTDDTIDIEPDGEGFIKTNNNYFQFDVTPFDSNYRLKS